MKAEKHHSLYIKAAHLPLLERHAALGLGVVRARLRAPALRAERAGDVRAAPVLPRDLRRKGAA